MPRLSELNRLKITARNILNAVQNKLNPRTYNAYFGKIIDKDRKDTIRKIINELNIVKQTPTTEKKTGKSFADVKKDIKRIAQLKGVVSGRERLVVPVRYTPNIVGRNQIQKFRFFGKTRYEYDNVKNYSDLYDNIKDAIRKYNRDADYVVLFIAPKDNEGKVRNISIKRDYLDNFYSFREALLDIIKGKKVIYGSDAIDEETEEVLLNVFDLTKIGVKAIDGVAGSSDKMLFKVEGIEETKIKKNNKTIKMGDCSKLCLSKIIKDEKILQDLDKRMISELNNIEGIKQYIEKFGLKISIICNSFLLKKSIDDIMNSNITKKMLIGNKEKKQERLYTCAKFNVNTDIDIVYLNKVDDAIATIIYDEFNNHFDIIKDNDIQVEDDIYISWGGKIIKDDKII